MNLFKKVLGLILFISITGFMLNSCGKDKAQVVEIKALKEYVDPVTNMKIKYPDGATIRKIDGKTFIATSSPEVFDRWSASELNPEGPGGGYVMSVQTITLNETIGLDSVKNRRVFQGKDTYSPLSNVKIDGTDGFKTSFKIPLNDGDYFGETYFGSKDSNYALEIRLEAFGGTYDKYKAHFDEIISSIVLPTKKSKETKVIDSIVEAEKPSSNLTSYQADGFKIQYPENFEIKNPAPPKGVVKSYNFIGERRADCNIRIDIIDASKNKNLDKIAKELAARFPGASSISNSSIGGERAEFFTYSPSGNVKGKVYLVIKGDKLFRVISNWFVGEEKDYLPIFERTISSISF